MNHFVKQKNLPYSLAEVKKVCASCPTCAELSPKFFSPAMGTLIKATQPMERLNIDFKGPLPSATRNKYFLCIVDEYSRFPFAFPCQDMSTPTVIKWFDHLFYTYGLCGYVHSDRWSTFKSEELKSYFLSKGVATSMSTPYHPMGNSQVERYNGIVWNAVKSFPPTTKLILSIGKVFYPKHCMQYVHYSVRQQIRLPMNVSLTFREDLYSFVPSFLVKYTWSCSTAKLREK